MTQDEVNALRVGDYVWHIGHSVGGPLKRYIVTGVGTFVVDLVNEDGGALWPALRATLLSDNWWRPAGSTPAPDAGLTIEQRQWCLQMAVENFEASAGGIIRIAEQFERYLLGGPS